MSSTDKALAQALRKLEGFTMPARRDDAAIEAAVADDPAAAPTLSAFELERRLTAERTRDPCGVARVRRSLGLSQQGFARRFGVPLATLRQWEQGVRRPSEPARVLLQLIVEAPTLVEQAAAKLRAA
jgi:DNA-binding transcriptional regulator YiaG